jgi:hypothetical protein
MVRRVYDVIALSVYPKPDKPDQKNKITKLGINPENSLEPNPLQLPLYRGRVMLIPCKGEQPCPKSSGFRVPRGIIF